MSAPPTIDRRPASPDGVPSPSPPMSPAVDRARVLGCAIDRLGMAEMVDRIDRVIAARDFAQHAAVNAAKLVAMRRDRELERIVSAAELISADGQSVVWASRVLSDPLPSRVAGIDLMFELFALAERRGYRRVHPRRPGRRARARPGPAARAPPRARRRGRARRLLLRRGRRRRRRRDRVAPAGHRVRRDAVAPQGVLAGHHGRRLGPRSSWASAARSTCSPGTCAGRRSSRSASASNGSSGSPRSRGACSRATCRATRASSSTWRATSRGATGTNPDAQRGSGGGAPTSSHSSATSVRQSQRSGLISASPRAAARQRATPAVAAASQTTEMMMRRRVDTASGPRAVPGFNARATESLCQFRYASRRAIQRSYQRLTQ